MNSRIQIYDPDPIRIARICKFCVTRDVIGSKTVDYTNLEMIRSTIRIQNPDYDTNCADLHETLEMYCIECMTGHIF